MSIFNSLRTLVLGVDLEEEQARADALNIQAASLGLAQQQVNVVADVNTAFTDSLADTADGYRRAGDSVIGGTLATLLRSVPVFVWLGLAAFVAWKLGLFKKISA